MEDPFEMVEVWVLECPRVGNALLALSELRAPP